MPGKEIKNMKTDDKLRLLNGKDFWTTYENMEYGIREIVFSDGPTGLRYQANGADHLGMNDSSEATCFPTSSALSCSWNPELAEEVSSCIAREAIEKGVDIVLAPGVNIKRSPLCGRNFEYYSEDPYLTKEMGAAFVKGLQKNGVGASLKHFAANNQEAYRMSINTVIDERALYEIYLYAFEGIVREAKPWTIMSAYNMLHGEHCSENRWLLTELLRGQWGFDGLVISDWYAVNDIVKSINSGLDLEMPSVGGLSFSRLREAYKNGGLDEAAVDRAVKKIAELAEKCSNELKAAAGKADFDRHHEAARRAAAESFVLLKNDNNALPVKPSEKVLYVGELMKNLNIQGNGSSRVNPARLDSVAEELEKAGFPVNFEPGYAMNDDIVYGELIANAVKAAEEADKIVVFAGLFSFTEAESYDRTGLGLPKCQEYLIAELGKLEKELIVVLQTGSAVTMPWIDSAAAVLQLHLSGQGTGRAFADVFTGKVSPSGKLTETYPLKLSHIPSYLYRGNSREVEYGESIFTGYRYYDKKDMKVLFPFGHGLSYTKFEYRNLRVTRLGEEVLVVLEVENTGELAGKDIVQVYAGLNEDFDIQPVRKLAAFKKIGLKPHEKTEVSFSLPLDVFKYYSSAQKEFVFASGLNTVEVGKSSRDIILGSKIMIKESNRKYDIIHANTTIGEILAIPELKEIAESQINTLIEQLGMTGEEAMNPKELEQAMFYMPLRNIVQVTNGAFTPQNLAAFIDMLNGTLHPGLQ